MQFQIEAPAEVVYGLLLDPEAVPDWKVPDGMTCRVHVFEPHTGGQFRVSLTYHQDGVGKSTAHTDTYHGFFVNLQPGIAVVEQMQFETADPSMKGTMTVTYQLHASAEGTELLAIHSGIPDGVSLKDNELGWSMALGKLAALAKARAAAGQSAARLQR